MQQDALGPGIKASTKEWGKERRTRKKNETRNGLPVKFGRDRKREDDNYFRKYHGAAPN
jgi:hypothetical protein